MNSVGGFSIGGSTITGFTGNPINYANTSGNTQHLTISNSSFYGNTGSVSLKPSLAGANGLFSSIRGLSLSGSGIVVDNTSAVNTKIAVLFDNSILRYNSSTAISVNSAGTSCPGASCIFVQVHLDKSELFQLSTALSVTGAGGLIDINDSTIVNVSTFSSITGGVIQSNSNNMYDFGSSGSGFTPKTPQ